MVAEVQVHAPVGRGGLRRRLPRYGTHLDAVGAGVVRRRRVGGVLVACRGTGAHGCFVFLSRFLHAEKPGTPVE